MTWEDEWDEEVLDSDEEDQVSVQEDVSTSRVSRNQQQKSFIHEVSLFICSQISLYSP